MKITIEQAALKAALGPVTRALADKASLLVLSHILIDATGDRIRITGTDLVTSITMLVDGTIEEPGRRVIESMLTDLVANLPAGPVTIEDDPASGHVTVRGGRNVSRFRTLDADDFPALPEHGDATPLAAVPGQYLSRMLAMVVTAAATEESRPVLTGVQMAVVGTTFSLAAADGYRMAYLTRDLDEPAPDAISAIVPARSCRELVPLIAGQHEPATVLVTPTRSHVVVATDEAIWTSRLIDGTFPNVRQIMPLEFVTSVTAPRADFLTSLRCGQLFGRGQWADQRSKSRVRLDVSPADDDMSTGSLTIRARNPEGGETETTLDIDGTGQALAVAIDGHMIREAVAAMTSTRVSIHLNGARQAIVLREAGNDRFHYVMMPIADGAIS